MTSGVVASLKLTSFTIAWDADDVFSLWLLCDFRHHLGRCNKALRSWRLKPILVWRVVISSFTISSTNPIGPISLIDEIDNLSNVFDPVVDLSTVAVNLLDSIGHKFLELTDDDWSYTLYDFFHFVLLDILFFSVLTLKLGNKIIQEIILFDVELNQHCTSVNGSTKKFS